ncbi:hypothetical protein PAAG_01122 [Paracoccidioides lutzii Pb01]|uniref:Uncharacterized protein n=1 Tax=Paracoccidioides lutzii (strain ATCC MYA-826 / Pb01) TaxID=502779 RepID=C1GRH7_PARBA|nr:hypothetical protein PAAG_01122 [Paracoccidioides lutzii Pb01]EEH38201.1 hypothetical protein PAAG_01122 [Paracoccidioides lutzii Pb01]
MANHMWATGPKRVTPFKEDSDNANNTQQKHKITVAIRFQPWDFESPMILKFSVLNITLATKDQTAQNGRIYTGVHTNELLGIFVELDGTAKCYAGLWLRQNHITNY